MTLRGVHFGSYWMGDNDVVSLMVRNLASLCELHAVDTGLYDPAPSAWCTPDLARNPKRPVQWLDQERVLGVVRETEADFVIVNSGGMSLTPETVAQLRKSRVVTVGISLSDPDVYPDHGAEYAHLYDLYYTNSLYSLQYQYPPKAQARWLPFAASTKFHCPLPEVTKSHDVVVVGHCRPDRLKVVRRLETCCSVGLFGDGWGSGSRSVHGEEHVRAINSGRVYLSFSATVAGYMNVKVGLLEAAACRICLVSQAFPEIGRFFRPGMEIALYNDLDELVPMVRQLLAAPRLREWLAENSYRRLLSEHCWENRWRMVLDAIQASKLG